MEALNQYNSIGPVSILKAVQHAVTAGENAILETHQGEVFLLFPGLGLFQKKSQGIAKGVDAVTPMKTPVDIDASNCRPLSELLWQLGHEAFDDPSWNADDSGCRRDDVIQLNHFPNLTRLPCTDNSARISMFLAARATCPLLAARHLHIDEAEVLRFYSAANAAGYIQVKSRTVSKAATMEVKTSPMSGLFSRIIGHVKSKSLALN
ncbi:MAG: hypothetical protein ACPGYX_06925 [Oceanobacter sp.]